MAAECMRCHKTNDTPAKSICSVCAEKGKEKYYELKAYRHENGLCIRCGTKLADSKYKTCAKCLAARRVNKGVRKKPGSDECFEKPKPKKPMSEAEKEKRDREKRCILKACAEEGISYGQFVAREYLKSLKRA